MHCSQAVIESIGSNLHIDVFHRPVVLCQPLKFFWCDIEIHIFDPYLILGFFGAGDLAELSGSEMERL